MWVLSFELRHDCTIGNRCEAFNTTCESIPLGNWAEDNKHFTSERHTVHGRQDDVEAFLQDLREDESVRNFERTENTVFFTGVSENPIPSSFYSQKLFFPRPVHVSEDGVETWLVASHDEAVLRDFFSCLQEEGYEELCLERLEQAQLNTLVFPSVTPGLSERQREVFFTAVNEGYYDVPKQAELKDIAQALDISVSTVQEHLRKAEAAVMPTLASP